MRAIHTGTLLSVVGAALFATGTFMYVGSEPLGSVLKRYALVNDYCWTALFLEVFGMMFLLIASIFLALRAQPAVSFTVAVGLLVPFVIVLLLREHHVLQFDDKSWTASLYALDE
jgi:membrane-bound ClpP family serine protease